ncbi:glycoside hydrolase family 16 protein [Sphingomonas qomolangmaensis]|uniref:Glycoside hydrolase family 16 protein n=1 Tax=Sphingomonas qomolangmaensis TaxID=2918765 RepID=A0ABY5L611_9SPHN|nr:glycoside hydrolase family 16 protein [Sphingomonas qomolangmaensis]UUL82393.1 glycoside hydrolase family 16 protein [Sphingomonas qomolangmaensis]
MAALAACRTDGSGAETTGEVIAPVASPSPVKEPTAIATPPPLSPPVAEAMSVQSDPLAGNAGLMVNETYVAAGMRSVDVPVCLKEVLPRQLTFDALTKNDTAKEGQDFVRTQVRGLNIPAGRTCTSVSIPIKADLANKKFDLTVSWSYNHPAVGGADYPIRGGSADAVKSMPAQPLLPSAGARNGRTLAWSSNFLEPVRPTSAPGSWRSRFPQHRLQVANREIAPNADPITDPGVDTHPIREGKRVIRAHHAPVREGGATYDYAASMMQSLDLHTGQYGYIEIRANISRAQGTIPAFWLLPKSLAWPPEIDIFEFGLNDDSRMKSTVHYIDSTKAKRMEGAFIPFVPDEEFHTYGLDWTPQWLITLVDGKEVHRRHNPFHEPMYIVVNVAVGGLAPAPKTVTPDWESTITLDRIEWWK